MSKLNLNDPQFDALSRLVELLFGDGEAVTLGVLDENSGAIVSTLECADGGDLDALAASLAEDGHAAALLAPANGEVRWVMARIPAGGEARVSLTPSVVVSNGQESVCVWRLDEPCEGDEGLEELFERGGCDLSDPIPTPGHAGWSLVGFEPDRVYTRDQLDVWLTPSASGELEPLEHSRGVIAGTGFEILLDLLQSDDERVFTVTEFPKMTIKTGRKRELSLGELVEQLCVFRKARKKDGAAYVFGELAENQRKNSAVVSTCAISLDFDKGRPIAEIDAAVERAGLFAVRYTTYSHGRTATDVPLKTWEAFRPELDEDARARAYMESHGTPMQICETAGFASYERTADGKMARMSHDPIERCRLVFPLADVFSPDDDCEDLRHASRMLPSIIQALAARLGLEDDYDQKATDLARLNLKPAVRKGGSCASRIFKGALLDWRSLDIDCEPEPDPGGSRPRNKTAKTSKPASGKASRASGKKTSSTNAGRALGAWQHLAGERFQLLTALRENAGDAVRRDKGDKLMLACPFDDGHSNPGDENDQAFFVANAAPGREEGTPLYVASCRHESCGAYTAVDMVAKLVEDKVLPVKALVDGRYFLGEVDEDARLEALLPALGREQAYELLKDQLQALPQNPDLDELKPFLKLVATSRVGELEESWILDSLWTNKKVKKKISFGFLAELKGAESTRETETLAEQLTHDNGTPFQLPEARETRLNIRDGRIWIEDLNSDKPYPLTTPFEVVGDTVLLDKGRAHKVEVGVYDPVEGWAYSDLTPSECADRRALTTRLFEMGLRVWDDKGAKFVHTMVGRKTGQRVDALSRAGFRDHDKGVGGKVFVLPTGQIEPRLEGVRLDRARAIPPGPGGDLNAWREAANTLFKLDEPTTMQLTMLAGFVGPLLGLVGDPSIALSIEGESSTGKTTGAEMAAAVWGTTVLDEGLMRSADGTPNSAKNAIPFGSGTMLMLDEFNSIKASARANIVMHLPGGKDKGRMRNGEERIIPDRWEPLVLMFAAETGFAASLLKEDEIVLGGLTARAVPILTKTERIVPDAYFEEVSRLNAHTALAGPAFIKALFEQGWIEKVETLKAMRDEKVSAITRQGGLIMRRSARLLAMMDIAGEIAREAGLFEPGDLAPLLELTWSEAMQNGLAPKNPVQRAATAVLEQLVHEHGASLTSFETRDFAEGRGERVGYYNVEVAEYDVLGAYVLRESQLHRLHPGVSADAARVVACLGEGKKLTPVPGAHKGEDGRWVWRGFPGLSSTERYIVIPPDAI